MIAGWKENQIVITSVEKPPRQCVELFRETFNGELPNYPVHYVAIFNGQPVGYHHVTRYRDYVLVGGLCVAKTHRRLGIATKLVEVVHTDETAVTGVFAYCGDPAAYALLTKAGYQETDFRHLIVRWINSPSLGEKRRIIAEVAQLGPF